MKASASASDVRSFDNRSKAPLFSLKGTLQTAVIVQLEELLCLARRGDVMGLAYAAVDNSGEVSAGAAGSLGRDNLRAAGAFSRALHMCHNSTED